MVKSEKAHTMPDMPKMEPTVYFNFDKDFKAPAAFASLTIGAQVTATITGKVQSLSISENSQSLTLEMKKVDLAKTGPKTIAEAKTIARERVKDFK